MVLDVPFYKRWLSYLYPVRIRKLPGNINPALELLLYNNKWQLATRNALYSDGDRYRPMVTAFSALREVLTGYRNILLLGTGLASALHVLHRMQIRLEEATLVDIDPDVLQLALACLPPNAVGEIYPVCADARSYMSAGSPQQFDLIVVDVFIGRVMPEGITEQTFLTQCYDHIKPGGGFVMNYMVSEIDSWLAFRERVERIYPSCSILEFGLNKIVIGRVPRQR